MTDQLFRAECPGDVQHQQATRYGTEDAFHRRDIGCGDELKV